MSKAERDALARVDHTCPSLDSAMDDLLDIVEDIVSDYMADRYGALLIREDLVPEFSAIAQRIKEQCTMPLREALVEACDEIIDLQVDIKELHDAFLR